MAGSLRYTALIFFVALSIGSASGPSHTQENTDVDLLNWQVLQLYRAGKYAEATDVASRALAVAEREFGANDAKFSTALNNLAGVYRAQGRYGEAEPLMKRALAIAEKALGPEHPDVGIRINNLAELYRAEDRYAEAEPLYTRALAIDEKALGPEHPNVGRDLNNLAGLYRAQGRFAEAEPLYQRAIGIAEKALGFEHQLGTYLSNLAEVYRAQGRYGEAEPLYKHALAIGEKELGPDHPDLGTHLNNLAGLYEAQGRYGEAELLYKRALAIAEKALGPEHPDVGRDLTNLAELYHVQGRYGEAELLHKRALAIDERALGPDHQDVAVDLDNLAVLYVAQGRYGEAEPLYKRALAIAERAVGPEHPDVGTHVNNLAELYRAQGRSDEAEPLYKRALAIAEKALGPNHPDVGVRLNNLGTLYIGQGRYGEAEPLMKRALAIAEKALGPEHPDVGTHLNNLAALYDDQGHYGEAEPLYTRALAIDEKALGPEHPNVGRDLNNLARIYYAQSDWARAADYWRRSTSVIIHRAQRGTLVSEALTGKGKSEAEQLSWQFWSLVKATHRLAAKEHDDALQRDMFQTAQWAQNSEAAQSLAQMAARSAKDDSKLAALVRERQDLVVEGQKRDQVRSAAVAQAPEKRNREAEAANSAQLTAIDTRIAAIDQELATKFPEYAALASPAPLSVEDAQKQLGADEALVLFLDTPEAKRTPEETFIWTVTKTDVRWVRSELGTPALTREVAALRCGLDYEGSWSAKDSRCPDLLKVAYGALDHRRGELLPFDLARAHELYKALFGQTADLIKDKRLLIVPSGPLTQLPFQVLVTEPLRTARPMSAADYRDVAWLVRKHAVTVLPAVSSLKALRELAKASHASEAYIGFGDPLLDGDPTKYPEDAERAKLAREKRCEPTLSQRIASLLGLRGGTRAITRSNNGVADVADLRSWSPLPETADELCDVAQNLGVDPKTHLYLGAMATEANIKQLSEEGPLAKYKIVHFATHGAVAGEVSRAAEPGLILTPPHNASERDDGYLTASEIAGLKLDADWVILSACNTAAGDAKGAEALSGLARAFFYAGARSLLVSHWEVTSQSTVKLITKAIAELKADPTIGRAEALRRSMLSMITTGKAYEAHPAFWAPFVLVGEGGAAR